MQDRKPKRAIVYVVNDLMYDFFVAAQESRLSFASDYPCYVIPFDENSTRIESLAPVFGFDVLKAALNKWDTLGTRIWGDTPHRPGVRKSSYFRKLAMFESPSETFLFIDANTIFVDSVDVYYTAYEQSGLDIAFIGYSLPGRNFQHAGLIDVLDHLSPNIRHGFNCGFIMGKSDRTLYATMAELAGPGKRLQILFGGAPEQAFLAYVAALRGKRVSRLTELVPQAPIEIEADSPITQRANITMSDRNTRQPGKRAFFLKWNGARIHDGLANYAMLKANLDAGLRRVEAVLGPKKVE